MIRPVVNDLERQVASDGNVAWWLPSLERFRQIRCRFRWPIDHAAAAANLSQPLSLAECRAAFLTYQVHAAMSDDLIPMLSECIKRGDTSAFWRLCRVAHSSLLFGGRKVAMLARVPAMSGDHSLSLATSEPITLGASTDYDDDTDGTSHPIA